MNLTNFVDVDTQNSDMMREFLDLNAIAHEIVFGELLRLGTVIDHYPLDVERPDEDWLDVHNREHAAWSNALALPQPPDLETVDFEDPLSAETWRQSHYAHHVLVAVALGL